MNDPQYFFAVFHILELRRHFEKVMLADGLYFHTDKILLDIFRNIVNDKDNIPIAQALAVEVMLQLRVEAVRVCLRQNLQLLDLINDAKVCRQVYTAVMGGCPCRSIW